MLWAALLLPLSSDSCPPSDDQLRGVATWALQFTPRVATAAEAVVMDVEASLRLFGGKRPLRERVLRESAELGVRQVAWAPTSLAALAVARAGKENGIRGLLADLLDPLPMATLSAARPHHTTLTQLGCRTLGDIRVLPRGGISRRFDKELLAALDQAYGTRPEAHLWFVTPEAFKSRMELPCRVETAPELMSGVRRLLLQLCGWLAARHSGTTAFVLRWMHDAMRPRDAGEGGELIVRTGAPMRNLEHLSRLLHENLAKVQLLAPAGDLELEALDVHALEEQSGSLIPDTVEAGESLSLLLERIAARVGDDKVLRPVQREDHRPELMQQWQPAPAPLPKKRTRKVPFPHPTSLLPQPLRLPVRRNRPVYQGPLHLWLGPHRVEGGWWDRVTDAHGQRTRSATRDYWVALSELGGTLLVYQERLAGDNTEWYLQGSY